MAGSRLRSCETNRRSARREAALPAGVVFIERSCDEAAPASSAVMEQCPHNQRLATATAGRQAWR